MATNATNPTNLSATAGHDAPITDPSQDRLGRLPVARNIHRVIVNAPEGWSTRVGLYGPWGEGKSSVLRLLRPLLEQEDRRGGKCLVVELSVWNEKRSLQVLERIHEALKEKLEELVKDSSDKGVLNFFKQGGESILHWIQKKKGPFTENVGDAASIATQVGMVIANAAPAGASMGKAVNSVVKNATESGIDWLTGPIDKRVRDFIAKLRVHGIHRVVVFVDDLDRADPKAVPNTLLALRELLDWPDFAFVLAFDREVIGEALNEHSKSFGPRAQGFLEKIIDVPIELPPPTQQAIERFASEELESFCKFIPRETREGVANFFPANPRKIRSLVRSLAVLNDIGHRLSPNDVDWRGLILQLMFRHWAPKDVWHAVEESWVGDPYNNKKRPKVEGKSFDEQCKETIQKLLNNSKEVASSNHDRNRLLDLGVALCMQRQNTLSSKIESELAMLHAPPAFTYGEIERLKNAGKSGDWTKVLDKALREANRRCSKSPSKVVGELFVVATSWYRETLSLNHRVDIDEQMPLARAQAESALSLMEHLWGASTRKGIQAARKDMANAVGVLDVMSWADVIDDRQKKLAQRVISKELDPVELHRACARDFLKSDYKGGVLSDLVEPSLLEWLIGALKRENGIEEALAGDDRRHRYVSALFGAPWSPLFKKEYRKLLLATLSNMRSGLTHEERLIGAQNAGRLLGRMLALEGNGIWVNGNTEFFQSNNNYFKEAWTTYMAVNWREEWAKGAIDRRDQLIKKGVPDEVLEVPAWLKTKLQSGPSEQGS